MKKLLNDGFSYGMGILTGILIMILIIMILTICANSITVPEPTPTTYSRIMIIDGIQDDTLLLRDNRGELWVYYGAEDWDVGDIAIATMDNNGTANIYDDIIITLQYDSLP